MISEASKEHRGNSKMVPFKAERKHKLEFRLKDLRFQSIKRTDMKILKTNFRRVISDGEHRPLIKCLKKSRRSIKEFHFDTRVTNKELRSLSEGIHGLNSLQTLTISINCRKVTDEGLGYLARALKPLCYLKNLNLKFVDGNQITDAGIYKLSKGLKRLRGLRSLSLIFEQCEKIDNEALKSLGGNLKRLSGLEDLCLEFLLSTRISDLGLVNLMAGLQRLKSLRGLNLNFAYCKKITSEGLFSICRNLKTLASSLQSLKMDFSGSEIDDKGLEGLSEALKPLVCLKEINVNLSSMKISGSGFKKLAEGLKGLTCLNSICFNIYGINELTGINLSKIIEELMMIPSLPFVDVFL